MYNCYKFNHKSFSYTVTSKFLITPDGVTGACDVCDKEKFNLVLCECLPTTITTPLQVLILVNGVQVPMLDRDGNNVFTNQLKVRKVYRGVYGSHNPHVLFFNEDGY